MYLMKCMHSILSTDMAEHFDMTIQIKENLTQSKFNKEVHASLLLCTLIHTADVHNPALSFDLSKKWSDAVLLEFNIQADREKEQGIPVTAMFDTAVNSPAQAKLNVNFIDYVVHPLWEAMVNFLPELRVQLVQMRSNRSRWQEMLDAEDPLRHKKLLPLEGEVIDDGKKTMESIENKIVEDDLEAETPLSPNNKRRRSMWL